MTSVEQILLKLGVDSSAVSKGLNSFKSKVGEFMSGTAGQLAGMFAFSKVMSGLDGVINKFGDLKDEAENFGVSTDFLQGFGMMADVTNSSLENVTKAVKKFQKALQDGRDGTTTTIKAFERLGLSVADFEGLSTEQAFYKLADGFKETGNQTAKVASAIDLLGRSGSELVTLLSKGSSEVKDLIDGANKLSVAEIEAIDKVADAKKGFTNWVQVEIGKDIGAIMDTIANIKTHGIGAIFAGTGDPSVNKGVAIAQANLQAQRQEKSAKESEKQTASVNAARTAMAAYSKHLDDIKLKSGTLSEKMAVLNRRLEEQTEVAMGAKDAKTAFEAAAKVKDIEVEIADIQKKAAEDQKKANDDRAKKTKELLSTERDIAGAQRDLSRQMVAMARAPFEEYMPTLEDLASSSRTRTERMGHTRQITEQGPFAGIAQNILNLKSDVRQAMMFGDIAGARQGISRIDELKGILEQAGVAIPSDHMESIAESTFKTQQHIADLVEKRASILMEPINGQ